MSGIPNLIESSNFSLQNLDNYYEFLKYNSNIIFLKYIEIVNTYCKLFHDTISIQNKSYYKYLFKNGLETISHVFNNILLYTNNLELTFYYCQKAYLYYVEFISQIDNVNHSFLQLNGKDASLFVYKKSIFEIVNDKRTAFEGKNSIKINNVKLLTKIYNGIIILLTNFDYTNISDIDEKTQDINEKVFNLYNIGCSRENSPMKRTNSGFNIKGMVKTASMERLDNIENSKNIGLMDQSEQSEQSENLIVKSRSKKKNQGKNNKNNKDIATISNDTLIGMTLHETIFNYKLKTISDFLDNIGLFYHLDDVSISFTIENNLLLYVETLCNKIKKYDIKKFTDNKSIINKSAFSKISELNPHKFINSIILE